MFAGVQTPKTVAVVLIWPLVFGLASAGCYASYRSCVADAVAARWGRRFMFLTMAVGCLLLAFLGAYGAANLLCMWLDGSMSL
jgi:hypothetical protein